ncbi:MAG: glycerophosphoryl diester phosphodiesterase membrane domain-containing protein [Actinobacteria bacterium]|nr:glycerophosphoryl diester phosphodiesterase membrane domain-containing protein [Actinomycetota bacterium]
MSVFEPPQPRPQLRPLGLGEIFDVAITIYRRNARVLMTLVLVVVAPLEVLSALLQASALPDGGDAFVTETQTGEIVFDEEFRRTVVGFGLAAVLSFLGATIATGACFKAIADGYVGTRAEWRPALGYAARRLHSILWVSFLGGLLAILGLLLLIVPGVYLYISFAVAVPVLLTEGLKGRHALGRSRQLVKGRFWPTFGVVVLGAILVGIVQGALAGLAGVASFSEGPDTLAAFVVTTIATVIGSLIATPLTAAFLTVLYFDLRVRKEAFDLQLLAQQVGIDPGASDSPARFREHEELGPQAGAEDDQPPFWPPPPGWKPRRDAEG